MRLVLASASPRRAELLTAAGYAFETCAVDVDEDVRPGETPEAYVRRLSREKAEAADVVLRTRDDAATREPAVVVAADTTVVVDSRILGKPCDDEEGAAMLRLLSGRAHRVLTGVTIRRASAEVTALDSTDVWFDRLSEEDIRWYVASREGIDKAGGYAIQGLASRFIPRIDGSYTNVVGLPIALVRTLIAQLERAGQAALDAR